MEVLRGLVEVLVNGLRDDPSTSLHPLISTTAAFKQLGVHEFTSSCVASPYDTCPLFDVEKLQSITKTPLDMSEDHLYQLQTDPNYVRRYVLRFWEGNFGVVEEIHAYTFTTMDIDYDAWTARHWSWLHAEVKELAALRQRYRDSIVPGERLPGKYETKLAGLEFLLLEMMDV
jgi:hypothetical protein